MGRHSPSRSRHGSRGRSPPRRRSSEDIGKKEEGPVSLLVRKIPLNCSNQDIRAVFGRFGPIRDVYMPRDHHSLQPRGFAFIEFADASDASEALSHMDNHMFEGRMISVVIAAGTRKGPEEMRRQTSARSNSDHKDHNTSRYGRSLSRSRSCYSDRARSRSHSPAPRWRDRDSASPQRKDERHAKSSRQSKEHDKDKKQSSCTPDNRNDHLDADNGSKKRQATPVCSAPTKGKDECQKKSPRQSKEHDSYKKWRSYTPEDINESHDRHIADNGFSEGPATATTDVAGSHPRQKSPVPSSRSRSSRRDDYSASPKGKEEGLAKSPRQSKEHDGDKKSMAYVPDDRNDRSPWKYPRPSSGSRSSRRDDHSASPKRKEELLTKSPRQSKEHDGDKKRMQYCPDDRNDCRDADSGHHKRREDYSSSPKIKEKRQAKSPRLSKEHDKDKRRSYIPDNRNGQHGADNCSQGSNAYVVRSPARRDGEGSNDRWRPPRPSSGSRSRRQDDYSAFAKTKEEPRAKSPRQSKEFDGDKKRRPYTLDDRNDYRDADRYCNEMQHDYSALPRRKEESQAKSPRQSKEHDEDKKRSYALEDRNDHRDIDNGCNERRETLDYCASSKRKEEPRQTESWMKSKEDEKPVKKSADDRNDSRDAGNASKEKPPVAAREESRPKKSPRPPAE